MIGKLIREFSSPAEAERHYFAPSSTSQLLIESANSGESCPTPSQASDPVQVNPSARSQHGDQDPLCACRLAIAEASPPECMRIISVLFAECLQDQAVRMRMPQDFLQLVASCLNNFHDHNRGNIIYFLVKGICTLHSDGSDTFFPFKRMSCGLVKYATNFFMVESLQQVHLSVRPSIRPSLRPSLCPSSMPEMPFHTLPSKCNWYMIL